MSKDDRPHTRTSFRRGQTSAGGAKVLHFNFHLSSWDRREFILFKTKNKTLYTSHLYLRYHEETCKLFWNGYIYYFEKPEKYLTDLTQYNIILTIKSKENIYASYLHEKLVHLFKYYLSCFSRIYYPKANLLAKYAIFNHISLFFLRIGEINILAWTHEHANANARTPV